MTPLECKTPGAGGRSGAGKFHTALDACNDTRRASAAQVARLRLTARCLGLVPVFVCDWPLVAELFDAAVGWPKRGAGNDSDRAIPRRGP